MADRKRTVLKKFYVTEAQNEMLNQLIAYTDLRNFSQYTRTMLLKKNSVVIRFEESEFENLIFSLRRIKNNLNQLLRIAIASEDEQAERAMRYSVQLVNDYEVKLFQLHQQKKKLLISKVGK